MKKKRRYERRAPAKQPIIAPEPEMLRLDLGCGQTPQPGFLGVDLYADNAKRFDLWSGERWPFGDSSVDEFFCSHVIEHIELGNRHQTYTGQGNLFMFFFEECYRIAKPGAPFKLIWPDLKSQRAFQDPTHCRFIPSVTMGYLDRNVREMNKLDHYLVKTACDWVLEHHAPTTDAIQGKLPKPVQEERYQGHWDFTADNVCLLRCRKT